MDVLHELELLPTHKEGIFVMPNKRVSIINSFWCGGRTRGGQTGSAGWREHAMTGGSPPVPSRRRYMAPKPHQLPLTVAGHKERQQLEAGGQQGVGRRRRVVVEEDRHPDDLYGDPAKLSGDPACAAQLRALRDRFESEAQQLQELRQKLLP